jgi:hypothetical protein
MAHDADRVRGGRNGGLSVTEARANFERFGASDDRVAPVRAETSLGRDSGPVRDGPELTLIELRTGR